MKPRLPMTAPTMVTTRHPYLLVSALANGPAQHLKRDSLGDVADYRLITLQTHHRKVRHKVVLEIIYFRQTHNSIARRYEVWRVTGQRCAVCAMGDRGLSGLCYHLTYYLGQSASLQGYSSPFASLRAREETRVVAGQAASSRQFTCSHRSKHPAVPGREHHCNKTTSLFTHVIFLFSPSSRGSSRKPVLKAWISSRGL